MHTEQLFDILDRAAVPEHSAAFMQAMSGGRAFVEDGFLFLAADDWLMGIGYPLLAEPGGRPFAPAGEDAGLAFEAALDKALAQSGATTCWAVAERLSERLAERLAGHPAGQGTSDAAGAAEKAVENRDEVYVLPADAGLPKSLRGPMDKARQALRVSEDRLFTPAHRRLWAEFLARADMRANVRELYARTEAVLAASRAGDAAAKGGRNPLDLRLLSAWDAQGNLAASLLLDYSPTNFIAYIIGAHSKEQYSAHATDLLFAVMLEKARQEGKSYVHLGLGVNQGIARFKRKWGGRVAAPYVMFGWKERGDAGQSPADAGKDGELNRAVRGLLAAPADMSKAQIFETLPRQRTFAMLYEVRKGQARSFLGGSAHFFRYSFEFSFRELFDPLHTVIFEGPLDEDFLSKVEAIGRGPEPGSPRVLEAMKEEEIARLERRVYGPEGPLARLAGQQSPRRVDVRALLAETRPWFGFFTTWVAWLERLGWRQSVDLEAWNTARDMGKAVIAMEDLDEQIASLESVPVHRVVDFFRRCDEWPAYIQRNVRTYLNGDLLGMMGSSIEFPSRTPQVINYRDERFRQRMRPFLEAGNCAVFVGTAHLIGLIPMLREDGFTVQKAYPSLRLRLRARARRLLGLGRDDPYQS